MSSKDYFTNNPTLKQKESDWNQGALDPENQGALDPITEEEIIEANVTDIFPPSNPSANAFSQNITNSYGNPTYPQAPNGVGVPPVQNQPTSNYGVANPNYTEPAISNIRPEQGGIMDSGQVINIPKKEEKKKNTGLIIGIIAAAVIILAAAGVFGYVMYQDKQAEIAAMEKDKEAAQTAANMIASIGEVSLGSEEAINNARAQYDALTDEQKEYVPNLADLSAAEKEFARLEKEETRLEEKKRLEDEKRAEEEKSKKEAAARQAAENKKIYGTLVLPNNNCYYGDYMVTANSGLILRYGPSQSYYKILTIPYGTYVPVYGWSGNWCYVSYGNSNGWVSADYLY